jgi:hypothetical protein
VIEQILSLVPSAWRPWFYRTGGGAEIDLLLERPGRKPLLAIEIKLSSAPTPSKGFWSALKDLNNCQGLVVCPVKERFPAAKDRSKRSLSLRKRKEVCLYRNTSADHPFLMICAVPKEYE